MRLVVVLLLLVAVVVVLRGCRFGVLVDLGSLGHDNGQPHTNTEQGVPLIWRKLARVLRLGKFFARCTAYGD
jgi:hypothetical protein